MSTYSPPWTAEEDELLLALKAQGLGSRDASYRLPGRTPDACCYRANFLKKTPAQRRAQADARNSQRKRNRDQGIQPLEEHTRVYVPAEVIAERDAALNLPRSLTAWFCGDPAPTRSALAQREVRT